MTTYERLIQEGKELGLQEGKELGLQEGTTQVLARLIAKKFQQDLGELVPLLNNLALDRQEELIERILQSATLQEVVDWLKSVAHN